MGPGVPATIASGVADRESEAAVSVDDTGRRIPRLGALAANVATRDRVGERLIRRGLILNPWFDASNDDRTETFDPGS